VALLWGPAIPARANGTSAASEERRLRPSRHLSQRRLYTYLRPRRFGRRVEPLPANGTVEKPQEEYPPMWRQTPEQRVWLAKLRQSDLFREADPWNLSPTTRRAPTDGSPTRVLAGYRRRAAGLGAFVRRTLAGGEAPCNEPCPDMA
jgi:hypothetical protein